jgi:hypothetical protein
MEQLCPSSVLFWDQCVPLSFFRKKNPKNYVYDEATKMCQLLEFLGVIFPDSADPFPSRKLSNIIFHPISQ